MPAADFHEAPGTTHDYDQVVISLVANDLSLAVEGKPMVTKWQRGTAHFVGRGSQARVEEPERPAHRVRDRRDQVRGAERKPANGPAGRAGGGACRPPHPPPSVLASVNGDFVAKSVTPARFALFVPVSLLTRWLSLVVEVLDMDEAAHAVGSWVLLDGGRLYTDFVDNKPPLLYALLRPRPGPRSAGGSSRSTLFTALLTVPLVALAASAAFRHERRGVAAGLLWLVYGASFLAHDMLAANAELVLLLPASWAIALVADERRATRVRPLLLAGLLLGLATLVKHQAAFWLPALGWAALARPPFRRPRGERRHALLALGTGFALPLLATWAAFAATGGAHDLVYWLVWRNVLYAANPITVAGALERAASYLLPWLLATAPLWWAWGCGRALLDAHHRRLVDGLVGWGFCPPSRVSASSPLLRAPRLRPRSRSGSRPRPMVGTALYERAGRVFQGATLVLALGFAAANAWLYLGGSGVYRERTPSTTPWWSGSRPTSVFRAAVSSCGAGPPPSTTRRGCAARGRPRASPSWPRPASPPTCRATRTERGAASRTSPLPPPPTGTGC